LVTLLIVRQVAVLEDRLAKSGNSESRFLDELNDLRSALEATSMAKKQAEAQVAANTEARARLAEANDSLSSRALTMAQDSEQAMKALRDKLQEEIDSLKVRLRESEEDADEQKMRGQSQRIQLLDEVSQEVIRQSDGADDIAQLASS
jgi:chromosome segregation ATPase